MDTMDQPLLTRIRAGDERAFEELYMTHFDRLVLFALRILFMREAAYDVVQDVFTRFWEQRNDTSLTSATVKTYLYSAVRNRAINIMKHEKVVARMPTDNPS